MTITSHDVTEEADVRAQQGFLTSVSVAVDRPPSQQVSPQQQVVATNSFVQTSPRTTMLLKNDSIPL